MAITKEELEAFGLKETEGDEKTIFPLKKILGTVGEITEDEEDEDYGELAICVTTLRNRAELCLLMPDGALLYLACKTIEELDIFEKAIGAWEPAN